MATHKDAIKRHRQSLERRMSNRHYRTMMRTQIKKLGVFVAAGDHDGATKQLPMTVSLIQRVAQKGIIHSNQAARRVSRLTMAVNGLANSAT